jgi:hypothetical protein
VNREARRRARLLDEIYPDPVVDSAPVIPAARPPVERVTLTAVQWELLVHADGQRTPADLAQLLGRAGYATIQELRRLAALGLLELPEAPAEAPDFVRLPRAHGAAVDIERPVVKLDEGPLVPVVTATAPAPPVPMTEDLEIDPAGANGTIYRPPRLARRRPGAKLPKDMPPDAPVHSGADEVLLKRIRTALRALR